MTECKYCKIKINDGEKFCSKGCGISHARKYTKDNRKGICKNCDEAISTRQTYCEKCSKKRRDIPPKKKYLTKNPLCMTCGGEKTPENTRFVEDNFSNKRCRKCDASYRAQRAKITKQKCIDYKGGCCQRCGYKSYTECLQFHHIDPSKKDFDIARRHTNAFDDETKVELDKCAILCANCHGEEHVRLKNGLPSLLTQVEDNWFDNLVGSTG